ncbi:MAG: L-threonylcarbamoyladenylate synthase [Candidatus Hermodarchaeota archaeon]
MTRRLSVNWENPEPEVIDEAGDLIRHGGVVILPTDTAYGLAGNPADATVINRVLEIKERTDKPGMPLLVGNIAQAIFLGKLPPVAQTIATKFWPGALTLIVPGRREFPPGIPGPDRSLALRMPNHPVTLAVIHATGYPIIGTSANKSELPSPRTADAAAAQVGSLVDLIIDAGPTHHEADSTIVNCTVEPPVIIREGAIRAAELNPFFE